MQALGGFANAYYQDAFEIEVYIEEGDAVARDAAFDELLQQPRKELSGAAGGRRRKTARILKV